MAASQPTTGISTSTENEHGDLSLTSLSLPFPGRCGLRWDLVRQQSHGNLVEKLLLAADLLWRVRRAPGFVVDAAHDQRKLLPQVYSLPQRQSITQLVEHRAQDAVGFGFARQPAVVPQLLQPFLRLLHGMGYSRRYCHRLYSLGTLPGMIVRCARRTAYALEQVGAITKRTNSDTGWFRG